MIVRDDSVLERKRRFHDKAEPAAHISEWEMSVKRHRAVAVREVARHTVRGYSELRHGSLKMHACVMHARERATPMRYGHLRCAFCEIYLPIRCSLVRCTPVRCRPLRLMPAKEAPRDSRL